MDYSQFRTGQNISIGIFVVDLAQSRNALLAHVEERHRRAWWVLRRHSGERLGLHSAAVVIEHKQTDCGRKIDVLALAAFVVDRRNKAIDRSSLGSSNFLQRSPECVLYGYAGSISVELEALSRDRSPVSGSGHRRLFQSHHHDLVAR